MIIDLRDITPVLHPFMEAGRYGCAAGLPADDKRLAAFERQRQTRGFDGTELWSLDHSLAKFLRDAMPAYRRTAEGRVSRRRWLDGIAKALAPIANDDFCSLEQPVERDAWHAMARLVGRLDDAPGLRRALAVWLAPRLAAFSADVGGYPADLTQAVWERMTAAMAKAFDHMAKGGHARMSAGRLRPGLGLFISRWRHLWT